MRYTSNYFITQTWTIYQSNVTSLQQSLKEIYTKNIVAASNQLINKIFNKNCRHFIYQNPVEPIKLVEPLEPMKSVESVDPMKHVEPVEVWSLKSLWSL